MKALHDVLTHKSLHDVLTFESYWLFELVPVGVLDTSYEYLHSAGQGGTWEDARALSPHDTVTGTQYHNQ